MKIGQHRLAESERHNARYLACLATGLFSFYSLLQLSIFNVIGSQLLIDFQLTTTQLGFLSSCFLWANALGLIPMGLLLDRYSVRKIALLFLCSSSLACVIIAYSHSLGVIALMRGLQGLASAASLLTSMRLAIRWFDKQPHLAIGFIVVLALCGGIAGNYGFSYLISLSDWRHALMFAAGLGGLIALALFFFLYDSPYYSNPKTSTNLSHLIQDLKSALLHRQNILGGILIGLLNAPIFVLATLWGNLYLTNLYQLSALGAASLASSIFVGVMLGSLGWGYLADRHILPFKVLQLGCSLALVLAILLFIDVSYSLLAVALLLFSLGFASSSQNTIYAMISHINPPAHISTATSIATLFENGIGASLQIIFGIFLHYFQGRWPGLILFCLVFSLSLGITYYLRNAFSQSRPING